MTFTYGRRQRRRLKDGGYKEIPERGGEMSERKRKENERRGRGPRLTGRSPRPHRFEEPCNDQIMLSLSIYMSARSVSSVSAVGTPEMEKVKLCCYWYAILVVGPRLTQVVQHRYPFGEFCRFTFCHTDGSFCQYPFPEFMQPMSDTQVSSVKEALAANKVPWD